MKNVVLASSLTLALSLLFIQMPQSLQSVMLSAVNNIAAVGVQSQQALGERLGNEIHAVVNNIHARVPNAQITHADVLAIMCMESGGQIGTRDNITSGAGARGITQVMPATLADYARSNKGGFYLDNRPDLLYRDTRFSIEAGALIFNDHLMKYVPRYGPINGRTVAAIAYNGGPGRVGLPKSRLPKETRDYAYTKLPNCFNPVKSGRSPINNTLWKAMVARVAALTGGRMSLGGAAGVPSDIPSQAAAPSRVTDQVQNLAQQWWSSYRGNQVQQQAPIVPLRQPAYPQYKQRPANNSNRGPLQTPTSDQGPSWLNRYRGESHRQRSVSSTSSNKATLTCEPTGRGVKIKWSCPSITTAAKGYAPKGNRFNTHGANVGAIEALNAPNGVYKIICAQSDKVLAEATCEIK